MQQRQERGAMRLRSMLWASVAVAAVCVSVSCGAGDPSDAEWEVPHGDGTIYMPDAPVAPNTLLWGVMALHGARMAGEGGLVLVAEDGHEVLCLPEEFWPMRPESLQAQGFDILRPQGGLRPGAVYAHARRIDQPWFEAPFALETPLRVTHAYDHTAPQMRLKVSAVSRHSGKLLGRLLGRSKWETTLRIESDRPPGEPVRFHIYEDSSPEYVSNPRVSPWSFGRTLAEAGPAPDGSPRWAWRAFHYAFMVRGRWVAVAAVDQAGNVGPRSEPVRIGAPGGELGPVVLTLGALLALLLSVVVWDRLRGRVYGV